LSANHCIGAVGTPKLRSRYQVVVGVTTRHFGDAQTPVVLRHVAIQDALADTRVADFPAYQHRGIPICAKKAAAAEVVDEHIPVDLNLDLTRPRLIDLDDPQAFPENGRATAEDVSAARGIRGVGKDWSDNVVSPDGTAWVESRYVRTDERGSFTHDSYYLAQLRNGHLTRTRLQHRGLPIRHVTGLQIIGDSVRTVGEHADQTTRWLLEYSTDGEPTKALELSAEQFDALREP
jgi:hypothetical protein